MNLNVRQEQAGAGPIAWASNQVLGQILSDQVPQAAGGFRVRVVDATVLNGPGQKAVQWRAHVSINPSTGGIRAVELTDDSGGEKLGRHQFRAGEVVLGDRGYATARGLYAVRQQEAPCVARGEQPGDLDGRTSLSSRAPIASAIQSGDVAHL